MYFEEFNTGISVLCVQYVYQHLQWGGGMGVPCYLICDCLGGVISDI